MIVGAIWLVLSWKVTYGCTYFVFLTFLQRREALNIWKQRLGSSATYRELINIFVRAGYCTYAENVREIACIESEADDSIGSVEAVPQSPHVKPHNPTSSDLSASEKHSLLYPAAVQGFTKRKTCCMDHVS